MLYRLIICIFIFSFLLTGSSFYKFVNANEIKETSSTVEQARLSKAKAFSQKNLFSLDPYFDNFEKQWNKISNYEQAKSLAYHSGNKLWTIAKTQLKANGDYDDRALYWQRLKILKVIESIEGSPFKDRQLVKKLASIFEKSSRGINDLLFKENTTKQIVLSGFDPFFLDKNIDQSNPSGVVAMMLDGVVIEHAGITAEINTFMVPVRFRDFDQGLIESTLAPFYLNNRIDMVVTVSMGRTDFDLERFPGKRRSAKAPDNLNVYSGGTKRNPIVPKLGSQLLAGEEFVEFSLPVNAMTKATGKFQINDNHQVTTLEKSFSPSSLMDLKGMTSVSGSGGGYLSNEISYRSINLRNKLASEIPTGHIHTPRIQKYDRETSKAIVEQIIEMLKLSLVEI